MGEPEGKEENRGPGPAQGSLGWQVGSEDRQNRQGRVVAGSAALTP